MGQALVIGNGESRTNIDLYQFNDYITIGCNALHRDFVPNHLVCCDARMVREALENPNTDQSIIHVRDNWHHYFRKILKNKHIRLVPTLPYQGELRADKPVHWGSGPYAVLIAANLGVEEITLLGFDLYGIHSQVNNIYKGTENYLHEKAAAVDPSYWIYQIGKIIECFPNIQFKILNKNNWDLPLEWQKTNVKKINLGIALKINSVYN
jgi:hypothetical protein